MDKIHSFYSQSPKNEVIAKSLASEEFVLNFGLLVDSLEEVTKA